jgi:16S rRNA processing protein RimM
MADFFAIGKLTGCFGVKGYLKLQVLTHSPERLRKLKKVLLGLTTENLLELTVEDVLFHQRSTVLKFQGIDDRTVAERYVGQFLFVREANVVKPPKGSFFVHDLIGCRVLSENGKQLGVIEDVMKMPSQDIWTIRQGSQVKLIPAVKDFILKVDIENRTVVVRTIEGLLEE